MSTLPEIPNFFAVTADFDAPAMLRAQAAALANMESVALGWVQRRQEALADLRGFMERVAETKDPAEVMRAQQELMAHAFARLSTDVQSFQQSVFKLMGEGVTPPASPAPGGKPTEVARKAA